MSTAIGNTVIAELIADRLPKGLPHPGDPANNEPPAVVRLPGFNTTGMSTEQAAEFVGNFAQLVAESIVNLIETDGGCDIVPQKKPPKAKRPAVPS